MPPIFRKALLITLALVPIASGREPSIAPQIKISPITVQHTTLPNGLQIYAVEDHASPTVAVQVWYHVGSKDDPNQRSGFAHLFEHMMFKGNEHLTPDTFEQLTENIGGENNAYHCAGRDGLPRGRPFELSRADSVGGSGTNVFACDQ